MNQHRYDHNMNPGDLVAARMSGGITIAKITEIEQKKVRILVKGKKGAKLPAERIVVNTGIQAKHDDDIENLRKRAHNLSHSVKAEDLWELLKNSENPLTLDDLAQIYWGESNTGEERIALLLNLEKDNLHFSFVKGTYTPRSQDDIDKILLRRRTAQQNQMESKILVDHLSEGMLPAPLTKHQDYLVKDWRKLAIYGPEYKLSSEAQLLIESLPRKVGTLQQLAFNLLTKAGVFSPDEALELERENINTIFSDGSLNEAKHIFPDTLITQDHRTCLTQLPTITIDDEGTKDRDDALSFLVEEPGINLVGIHITDVATLLPPDGPLEKEAQLRLSTLYLPEQTIPMLPEMISEDKGSLDPQKTRGALSILIRFADNGNILNTEIIPSIVRSDCTLTYEEADAAFADSDHKWHDIVVGLINVSRQLEKKRQHAGAMTLNRKDMMVKVANKNKVTVKIIPRNTPSRVMVSEFMILYNSTIGEFCHQNKIPAVFRTQAKSDFDNATQELLSNPEDLNELLEWYLTVRRMPPAETSLTPAHHSGLGVSFYLQITSPLRRYSDMIMQRQVNSFLQSGQPLYRAEYISTLATQSDVQMKTISRIEEARKRYWFLKFLQQSLDSGKISDSFEAMVLENRGNRPALLDLLQYPFRVRTMLPNQIGPGQKIRLKLHGIDMWRRSPLFTYIS